MIETIDNEITYKLGQNAQENFDLIDEALINNKDYWWIHLNDYPSGHCIIESTKINNQMINVAGRLIKLNSKYDNMKTLKLIYTHVKNIKKTDILGHVTILNKPYYKDI